MTLRPDQMERVVRRTLAIGAAKAFDRMVAQSRAYMDARLTEAASAEGIRRLVQHNVFAQMVTADTLSLWGGPPSEAARRLGELVNAR